MAQHNDAHNPQSTTLRCWNLYLWKSQSIQPVNGTFSYRRCNRYV